MSSPTTYSHPFLEADFDWVTRLEDVWTDPVFDVAEIHVEIRDKFRQNLNQMHLQLAKNQRKSPLGWVLLGSAGTGKTHLLSAFRHDAAHGDATFVMVDMTDIRNFWQTVLQGYVNSLHQKYRDDQPQYKVLIYNFIKTITPTDKINENIQKLSKYKVDKLTANIQLILKELQKTHPKDILKYQNVVRALICMNSADFDISNAGWEWLQNGNLSNELQQQLGFISAALSHRDIVAGISWLMSLCGPSILAFDQLDPIVHQISHIGQDLKQSDSEEYQIARSIIEEIGGGFSALRDITSATLTIICCIENTWDKMNNLVLKSNQDRFLPPDTLKVNHKHKQLESMILSRLTPVYNEHGFTPEYSTWPLSAQAIKLLEGATPREVLKKCDQYRKDCESHKSVQECLDWKFTPSENQPPIVVVDEFKVYDQKFAELKSKINLDQLLLHTDEVKDLDEAYQIALRALVIEQKDSIPDNVDLIVEKDFTGSKQSAQLHARLRAIFNSEGGREEHYCLRIIQHSNATAFTNRLQNARVAAGIDPALKFRQLTIVRTHANPTGKKTEETIASFRKASGKFHKPSTDELKTLLALRQMSAELKSLPKLHTWLERRKIVSNIPGFIQTFAPCAFFSVAKAATETPQISAPQKTTNEKPNHLEEAATGTTSQQQGNSPDVTKPDNMTSTIDDQSKNVTPPPPAGKLVVGHRIIGPNNTGSQVDIPLWALSKHSLILGGAGSGKTVTIRRLIEQATLAGIPSIIIDCAQDLCAFDEKWPSPPESWKPSEEKLAERFFRNSEMIVWTPAKESGNPLSLDPFPDFTPVLDDADEFESAVHMVAGGLRGIVAQGNSAASNNKLGLLIQSLKYFARQYPQASIAEYIEMLDSLPPEAGLGLSNEAKVASQISDSLKVELAKNPLLNTKGAVMDPLVLFGDNKRNNHKVRLSVISLIGLPSLENQCAFINQLAMMLFTWIKKNPTPPDNRPLRGLLIIDEAKDFVPATKSTYCKESIMRLAAQARKYKLGLVLATQHPKDIDNKIVNNCSTHLYGLNSSPNAIEILDELMKLKGASTHDIAKLKKGQFYISSPDMEEKYPVKTSIPLSLSASPANPLDEAAIIKKAKASRIIIDEEMKRNQ